MRKYCTSGGTFWTLVYTHNLLASLGCSLWAQDILLGASPCGKTVGNEACFFPPASFFLLSLSPFWHFQIFLLSTVPSTIAGWAYFAVPCFITFKTKCKLACHLCFHLSILLFRTHGYWHALAWHDVWQKLPAVGMGPTDSDVKSGYPETWKES